MLPRVLAFLLLAAALPAQRAAPTRGRDSVFAAAVVRLSEPGGYFDTDNLISNETSYLHVATRLEAMGVRGGAYIGVGPDQNFSYLTLIRPEVAFLIDIRRDNMLQHLLFKALFTQSRSRLQYLCLWLGCRQPPAELGVDQPLLELLAWVDSTRLTPTAAARVRQETARLIEDFGVPLDARDRETIARFHTEFQRTGLMVRFSSFGRGNDSQYPTLRRLLLERDLNGAHRSYLARDEDWRFVRELQVSGRVIPVVGDLGGRQAFRGLARELRQRQTPLSALYTSNAELYIWRDGSFPEFASSVAEFPLMPSAVIIRSHFDRSGRGHPLQVDGHMSVQLLARVSDFNRRWREGALRTYADVITRDAR